MKTRDCTSCGHGFWDDGNTLCPRCDAAATARMPGVLPDASARVLAMRTRTQARIAQTEIAEELKVGVN